MTNMLVNIFLVKIPMIVGIIMLIASYWIIEYQTPLSQTAWTLISLSLVVAFMTATVEVFNKRKNSTTK